MPSNTPLQDLLAPLPAPAAEALTRVLVDLPGSLVDPRSHFYWLYLITFALIGLWGLARYYPRTGQSWFARLFPREIYRHPSALLDVKLLLMNRLLAPSAFLTRVVLGSGLISLVALWTQTTLEHTLGRHAEAFEWTVLKNTLVVILLTLVRDFATFVTHALSHKVPLLWEFHKVHHSAAVLTPLTIYRKHPVYNLFGNCVDLVLVAPLQGLVAWLFIGEAQPLTLFGANLVFSAFHFAGANLRHSHIWVSFGPILGRIFISPAQHQIHHSRALAHWDRNFGEVFAIWDWMFGTLYLPGRTREVIEFGVAGSPPEEHDTLWKLYWVPFVNCASIVKHWFKADTSRAEAPSP